MGECSVVRAMLRDREVYCIGVLLLRLPLQHKAGVNGGPEGLHILTRCAAFVE